MSDDDFVTHHVIVGSMSGKDLQKIDLDKESLYKKKKEFYLGVVAENELKTLNRLS